MHIIALPEKSQHDYLMYVFAQHVKSGLDPEELSIAGQVWATLKGAKELDPSALEAPGPEVIRIPGPLSVVHHGDVSL